MFAICLYEAEGIQKLNIHLWVPVYNVYVCLYAYGFRNAQAEKSFFVFFIFYFSFLGINEGIYRMNEPNRRKFQTLGLRAVA
jgi:hypothetical protein